MEEIGSVGQRGRKKPMEFGLWKKIILRERNKEERGKAWRWEDENIYEYSILFIDMTSRKEGTKN